MSMTPKGILRTVGLWILILATSASSIIDFTQGHSRWGWFKFVVAIIVIVWEISSYIKKRITISTDYKKFIQEPGFWGEVSLTLFALALAGLILHLAVW